MSNAMNTTPAAVPAHQLPMPHDHAAWVEEQIAAYESQNGPMRW